MYWSTRWRALRLQVFARDLYNCQACGRPCTGQGRADPLAPECDHIKPHNGDPALMWDTSNLQTLHKRCHSIKTSIEDGGMHSGAQAHPDWLPTPACDVALVCGPAGAGKTTWAKAQAGRQDQVIDLDECFAMVCGTHGHDADKRHLSAALRVRNKMLANLASERHGTAYFIVSAPTQAERDWWADKLGAEVHLIAPPLDDILSRDIGPRRKRLASEWHQAAAKNEWAPPKRVREVGLDGYPVQAGGHNM